MSSKISDCTKSVNHITIDVTHGCNLCCKHCFNNSGVVPVDELTDDQLILACEQIISVKPETVCICGGEPLMRSEIVLRMIELLKNSVKFVSLTTNGTLITPETALSLRDVGIDAIQVSIDGDKESHNWLRGSSTAYDRTISGIANLLKAGIEVQLSFIPNSRNLSQLPDTVEEFTKMGISLFNLQPLQEIGRGKSMADYGLDSKDTISLKRKIDSLSEKYNCTMRYGNPVDYAHYLLDHDSLGMLSIDNRGWLMVTPYAPIYLGNVNRHSLKDYYDHELAYVNSLESIKSVLHQIIEKESYDVVDDVGVYCDIIDESFDEINNRIFSAMQSKREPEYAQ